MKLYESLNKQLNKQFNEGALLAAGLGAALPAAVTYFGGKQIAHDLRKHVFHHDSPSEFNFVNGGMFSSNGLFGSPESKFKTLNQRIVKNVLGPYLRKDAAGNLVFNNSKLAYLKKSDPELFKLIYKLQTDIARGNNRSNLWMSRKHLDAIRIDVNRIEEYLSTHNFGNRNIELSPDALKILNKHPLTRSLLQRYRNSKPGSEEQMKLYSQLMNAERELIKARKNSKMSSSQVNSVYNSVDKTEFYK